MKNVLFNHFFLFSITDNETHNNTISSNTNTTTNNLTNEKLLQHKELDVCNIVTSKDLNLEKLIKKLCDNTTNIQDNKNKKDDDIIEINLKFRKCKCNNSNVVSPIDNYNSKKMKINLEKKRLDRMSENNIEISYIKIDNDNIMINKQFDCDVEKIGVRRKLSFNSSNHKKQIKSSSTKNLNRHKSLYSKSDEKKTKNYISSENSLDNFDSTELIFISDEYINKITKQENVIVISDRKMLGKTKSVELLKYQAKDRERRCSLNKLNTNKNICDTEEKNLRSCKKVIIKINNSKEKSGSQDVKVINNTCEKFGKNLLLLGLETYEEPIMLEVKKLEKKKS